MYIHIMHWVNLLFARLSLELILAWEQVTSLLKIRKDSRNINTHTMPAIISQDAYTEFEGIWKNFRFRRIEPEDHDAVYAHIKECFLRDEPTCALLGYTEELANDFCHLLEIMLKDNMSFLAQDIESGEIAGVRVTFHHTPNTEFAEMTSDSGKKLVKMIGEVEEMAEIEKNLGEDNWAELFLTSTSPKFRQLGLASEFYKRSIAFLQKIGFKNAIVIVSSPYTRMATEKLGFKELSCLNYKDIVGFDGQPMFSKGLLNEKHFACCKVKPL